MEDLKKYAEKITKSILEYLSDLKPEILKLSSSHLIESGGKRLRPYLLIKIAEHYDKSFEDAKYAAIAVELIHNFSLVHDDIMDNDEFRHGRPTVHKLYGIPFAILAGDTLFSLAFNAISRMNVDDSKKSLLYQELAVATKRLSIGQAYDMFLSSQPIFDYDLYYETIKNKTSSLFECSAVMGAIIGGAEKEEINAIRNSMLYAGMAFQIKDDILGVFGDPKFTGKPAGNDIREGKKTLILIYSREKLGSRIENLVSKKSLSEEEIISFIKELEEIGAKKYALKIAEDFKNKAIGNLEKLNSRLKEFLRNFIDFLVSREF